MKGNMSFDKMMDLMRDNFEHMQESPLVKSLRKENRRLIKENKQLMSIIKGLHISKKTLADRKPAFVDLSNIEDDDEEVPLVKIKIEKTEKTDGNIVYELIEKEPSEKEVTTSVPLSQEEIEEGLDLKETIDSLDAEEEEVEEEEEEDEVEEEEGGEKEDGLDLKGTVDSIDEETEVYEVTIRGKQYFTTDQNNGVIYAMDSDGDVGDEIGFFVNGVAKV